MTDPTHIEAPRTRLFKPLAALRDQPTGPGYEIKAQADSNPTTILLYDEIGGWFGVEASTFVRDLMALDTDRIHLHINSPGGSVYDGLAIYQALRNHKAHITTHIDGLAASSASLIALAGDRRIIGAYGTAMVHNPWGLCLGDADDMARAAQDLGRVADTMASLYAKRAGGETSEWREVMAAETWFTAEEAVAAGLVHEVQEDVEKPDPDGKAQARWDLSVFAYAGREQAPAPRIPRAAQPARPAASIDLAPTGVEPAARPDPTHNTEEDKVSTLNAELRQWLGLADDPDDAAVAAAVKARQDEHDRQAARLAELEAKAQAAEAALAEKTQASEALAEKVTQLDEVVREQGSALAAIKAERDAATKASLLDEAEKAGKFTPADRAKWEARYDKSPEVTAEVLGSIPTGSAVPVAAVGHTGPAEPAGDLDAEWASVAHVFPPAETATKGA